MSKAKGQMDLNGFILMVQPLGEVTLVKGEREKKKGKKSIFALI